MMMWARLTAAAVCAGSISVAAQTCTTQARMVSNQRSDLAEVSLALGNAVKAGDVATVGKLSGREIAQNFAPTGFLVRNLSEATAADSLAVTQLYELDAHAAPASGAAEFACPLSGSGSETDFSIDGLPPGLYAFTMVEATGPRPWLYAFLLRQDAGQWKMAGFYPHARTAAGHDGLWFWNEARAKAKAGQAWQAWLAYGTADALLRPANFVSTTHLEKLRSERGAAAPPELRDGLSAETPLVVKAVGMPGGPAAEATVAITGLSAEGSDDGKRLNLVVHYRGTSTGGDGALSRLRNVAAVKSLLAAHPELRTGFDGFLVFADVAGEAQPFATELRAADVP